MIACTSPAFASSERPLRMSLPATRTWRLSILSISVLPLSPFEFVDISQVLRSPAGTLVDQQVLDRDQRNTHSAELGIDPAWIAIIEFARRDPGQQVYPVRRSAQHQDGFRVQQVFPGELVESEFGQCRKHLLGVGLVSLQPEIDVFRRAYVAQRIHGDATDDQVPDIMRV